MQACGFRQTKLWLHIVAVVTQTEAQQVWQPSRHVHSTFIYVDGLPDQDRLALHSYGHRLVSTRSSLLSQTGTWQARKHLAVAAQQTWQASGSTYPLLADSAEGKKWTSPCTAALPAHAERKS